MNNYYGKFLEKRLKETNIQKYAQWWFKTQEYGEPPNFYMGLVAPVALWFLSLMICITVTIILEKLYLWNISQYVVAFVTIPALVYYMIFFSLFFIVPIAQTIGAFSGALVDTIRFRNRFKSIDNLYSNDPKYIIPGSLFGYIPNDKINFFHYGNPFIDKLNTEFFDDLVEIIQVDGDYVLFAEKMHNRNVKNIKLYYDKMGYNYYVDDNKNISMKICDFCDIYRYTGKYNKDYL